MQFKILKKRNMEVPTVFFLLIFGEDKNNILKITSIFKISLMIFIEKFCVYLFLVQLLFMSIP